MNNMKYTSIIIAALLLGGCSKSTEIGRYQLSTTSTAALKIDTVTGRTWVLREGAVSSKLQFSEVP